MNKKFVDYFLVLEVHYLVSDEVLQVAYRRLANKLHPDNGGSHDEYVLLNEAYHVLSHQKLKKDYLKEWSRHYIRDYNDESMNKLSLYDYTLNSIRQLVLEYMFFIQNKDYEQAYDMLSKYNQKKIFKKDFILWQKLIAEIHELLEYECTFYQFDEAANKTNITNQTGKIISFKVKVKERNVLLDRIEEDYFIRNVLLESSKWCVLLSDIDIKYIIKKYKRIIAISKKNKKKINQRLGTIDDNFSTRFVSKKVFIHNCEYERLRYMRYNNPFVLLAIEVKNTNQSENSCLFDDGRIREIEKTIRRIDSFCVYSKKYFLVLLPETDILKSEFVIKKINDLFRKDSKDEGNDIIKITSIESARKKSTIKEMIKEVIKK